MPCSGGVKQKKYGMIITYVYHVMRSVHFALEFCLVSICFLFHFVTRMKVEKQFFLHTLCTVCLIYTVLLEQNKCKEQKIKIETECLLVGINMAKNGH